MQYFATEMENLLFKHHLSWFAFTAIQWEIHMYSQPQTPALNWSPQTNTPNCFAARVFCNGKKKLTNLKRLADTTCNYVRLHVQQCVLQRPACLSCKHLHTLKYIPARSSFAATMGWCAEHAPVCILTCGRGRWGKKDWWGGIFMSSSRFSPWRELCVGRIRGNSIRIRDCRQV